MAYFRGEQLDKGLTELPQRDWHCDCHAMAFNGGFALPVAMAFVERQVQVGMLGPPAADLRSTLPKIQIPGVVAMLTHDEKLYDSLEIYEREVLVAEREAEG